MTLQIQTHTSDYNPIQYVNKIKPCCGNCVNSDLLNDTTKEQGICYFCYKLNITVSADYYCPKHEYSK